MSVKTIVSVVVIIIVLILIAIGISALGDGNIEPLENIGNLSEEVVEEFIVETRAKVIAELGQPIEGFEPFMFLSVYPGLEENDFDGVKAMIGTYQYRDGQLIHEIDDTQPIHSAAAAISDEGMATLLANVSSRLGISVETEADILGVIRAISTESNVSIEGDTGTITGEVVCLPHKDREGPQTMECAFGFLADNGHYYGLSNLNQDDLISGRINTGDEVRVFGTARPPEPNNIYDILAIIEVETIEEI